MRINGYTHGPWQVVGDYGKVLDSHVAKRLETTTALKSLKNSINQ